MITITKEVYIEGINPSISLSDVPEGNYEIVIVLQPLEVAKSRSAGFSKASFTMTEDFNEPLEDFNDYR
jgi:hypothetical protein